MEFKIEIKRLTHIHTHAHTDWIKIAEKLIANKIDRKTIADYSIISDRYKKTNWSRAASIGCQSQWIYIALMNYENSESTSILIRLFNKSIGFQTRRRKCGILIFFFLKMKRIFVIYVHLKQTNKNVDRWSMTLSKRNQWRWLPIDYFLFSDNFWRSPI